MKKIIFLDIDGVLIPEFYRNFLKKMKELSVNETYNSDEFGHLFFDQSVKVLEKIITSTDAYIVISSTWKDFGFVHLKEMWRHRNLPGCIIDMTPSQVEVVERGEVEFYDTVGRGAEIASWIKWSKFDGNYVIIDDTIDDMLASQSDKIVEVNSMTGLISSNADKAIAILNKIS